ncbi:MAG: septal ring lytic transglycosylase RlpA family protein [Parafilimonas terrae]|nr:septal ring lytic transglycosylase RlpA family protein [Parafilimonas terrae]
MKHGVLAVCALVLAPLVVSTGAEAHGRHSRGSSGGMASWYGGGFQGHRTASGQRFNTGAFTAAHRFWPFGTRVRVTNQTNGRSVIVVINDRGPFVGGRVIDLSHASARAIGMSGTARVTLARLS